MRTAAILILLAGPALAEEPCFITKRVPVDWSQAQPPLPVDGGTVQPSDTPTKEARYTRWLKGWRAEMAAKQETVRKVEVPCPAPLPLARWQQPGAPFPPPGSVVTVPHEDYPPDARPWDRTPRDGVPVPAPGAWAVAGGLALLIGAKLRKGA